MTEEYMNGGREEKAAGREPSRLSLINCEELSDMRFRAREHTVEGLLSPGLAVLAGSPKVGKSWLVMQLCMSVATGAPFLGMKVSRGAALYLALEDSLERLQRRMLGMTESYPDNLCFAVECSQIGENLLDELGCFVFEHPDAKLIVIDTFQKIRGEAPQMSYANDYSEVSWLKRLADKLHICILLVHHTRKLGDSDAFNEISGTNGIAGSADTLMVLKKEKRADRKATLTCTGRDIEDRELEIKLSRTGCAWELMSDTYSPEPAQPLPEDMAKLVRFVRGGGKFDGLNSDFTEAFNRCCSMDLTPEILKRKMNKWRYELERYGIQFLSVRSHGVRRLKINYYPPNGSQGDASTRHQKGDASPDKR